MPGRWILAVDLGTGGPKVARVGLDGSIRATAFRPVDTRLDADGGATQDATNWWWEIAAACREVAAGGDPSGLHAVAITGQWGSTVPVGFDGAPTGPALLWSDTRARDLVRSVIGGAISVSGYSPRKVLPFVRVAAGAPNTDGADPTGHALLLKERFAEQYARTAVLLEPVDFVGLCFTGITAATPPSMTLSWLLDHRPGTAPAYVEALVRRARRDYAKLPELRPTGSVLGSLLPAVADEIGVRPGVPVICGIPDLHAAVIGSGSPEPYSSHVTISTSAWIGARVPFKKTDLFHSIATVPGLDVDHPVIANNHETGGGALGWLRDEIFGGSVDFDEMISWADDSPVGSDGVIFTPWLGGERSPVDDKLLRGGWLGLSLRTGRGELVRSVMEGVAYNARWLFDPYQKFLGRRLASVRILGGGALSPLWCQMHADIMNVVVEQVADPRHAQLRGVALWARVCLGELTIREAGALVPVAARFEPRRSTRATYEAGYVEFGKLAGTLKGFYHRMAARQRRA